MNGGVRKAAVVAMAVFSLLAALAACGSKETEAPPPPAAEGAAPLKIRLGVDSYSFSFQFRVAQGAGIFKKHGIDAEISTYSFGIDTIDAAILGQTDSAEGMDYAVASRFSESNALRIVAYLGGPKPEGEKLYTRLPDVHSVADLKGRTLGVKKGTVNEYIWGRTLQLHGIDPKEVKQVYLGSAAELLAAYQTGEIDAMWVSTEVAQAVQEVPGSRVLGDLDLAKTVYRGYLLLDEKFLQANKAGVVRLLRALDEASAYIAAHPEETAQIIYDDLKVPKEAVLEALKFYDYDIRLSREDLDHIVRVTDWSVENGLIRNKYDIRRFLHLDALRTALPEKLTVPEAGTETGAGA
ncbi:MAG: ABC transporter substrate-binding protein [Candidatus Accumulibacter sp.]|jgi:NitT/TauT family transport system substrate-binding protein|nr:ABC transporter substrate-binding protein [Accumulibacter sp.]